MTPRILLWVCFLLVLLGPARAADTLFFREDWKEIPFALPITAEHVSNPALRLETHGPGRLGIKKSHHAEIENDPYYVWSGRCRMPWAVLLRKMGALADLSSKDATVRWRSRQSGDHALHLLVKLPGERWFVSEQSDSGQEWHEHEFRIRDLTWRYFSVIKAVGEERVPIPDLRQVEQIGFTDQKSGKGSPSSSRLDWIEVYGRSVKAPKRQAPEVRATRVVANLPESVQSYPGLVFTEEKERALTLDLYRPKAGQGPFPTVIFIHGGGWYKGDPSSYNAMAQQLAARGYVTLNIHYRLSGEASFPAAIFDCKSAVRWARAHATTFRIDPTRIGAVGGSAGGHLSGLLGTAGQSDRLNAGGSYRDESSAIQACVVMAGAMDLTTPEILESAMSDPRRRMMTFMGGAWGDVSQNYIDASPMTHVSKQTPPMLFMDGEFDRPGERYKALRGKLDELGIHHQFHVIKGGPHPFWSQDPFFKPALKLLVQFFDRTLKDQNGVD